MRRSLLALAVASLLASPAAAQITPYASGPTGQSSLALTSPTAPSTDSSNRIATTAWVNNYVNAALPLAAGKIWIGSVGNIATPQTPSGDLTMSNGGVFTFGTVNANVGSFGSVTSCPTFTVNAKGLITAASQATCTPAVGSITGLAANMATWLATSSSANLRAAVTDETGTGLLYFQGGDIGTPSAGVGSNLTALNGTQITTGTIPAARTNGHQNGTATNDAAAAGEVGELIEATLASGSATSLTTATAKDIITISLTAGDWDLSGIVHFQPTATTSMTAWAASLSATLNTLDITPGRWGQWAGPAQVDANAIQKMQTAGPFRISLNATTTLRLVAQSTFTASTLTAYGYLRARRMR